MTWNGLLPLQNKTLPATFLKRWPRCGCQCCRGARRKLGQPGGTVIPWPTSRGKPHPVNVGTLLTGKPDLLADTHAYFSLSTNSANRTAFRIHVAMDEGLSIAPVLTLADIEQARPRRKLHIGCSGNAYGRILNRRRRHAVTGRAGPLLGRSYPGEGTKYLWGAQRT